MSARSPAGLKTDAAPFPRLTGSRSLTGDGSPTGLLIHVRCPPGWDARVVNEDQPIVLVGSRQLPQGEDDSRGLASSITGQGWPVRWASWDDTDVDWLNCPLAVLRTPWDYTHRLTEFLAWADAVPRLANSAAVVRWNSDKRYLQDLETAGVPIVPTVWVHAGHEDLPAYRFTAWGGDVVVKPTVAAGGRGAKRIASGADLPANVNAHTRVLHAENHVAMVQPYLEGVETEGETSLIFLGGRYSHAVSRGAVLRNADPAGQPTSLAGQRGESTPRSAPRQAASEQLELAHAALAAIPGAPGLLYARVDVLPDSDGFVVGELELIEPTLFLQTSPTATARFAEVIGSHADRSNPPTGL